MIRASLRVLASIVLLLPLAAAARDAERDNANADPSGEPFVFEGQSWVSQKAFVESGARCSTRPVDEEEALLIEQEAESLLAEQGRPLGPRHRRDRSTSTSTSSTRARASRTATFRTRRSPARSPC